MFLSNLLRLILQIGKEQIDIRNDQRTSCADAEVEQVVETIRRKTSTQDEEGGFTKKLKSILLNDR